MAVEKKHSIQRKVYHKTRSAVRRWRAEPLATPALRKIKIFTNVQSAAVAGITRVMSSFAEYVNASTDVAVDLVCVTVASPDKARPDGGWMQIEGAHPLMTTLVYEGILPQFGEVLQSANTINDVQSAHQALVDAYSEQLRKEKPDIVLVNGTYIVAWALLTAARRLRYPVILYYHGSLTKETEHWKEEKHRRLMRDLETSFDRADVRYVFPSALVKHYVERNIFRHTLRRGQSLVLPNPIPKEFFDVQVPSRKSGVAFVGRWTRVKNPTFVKKFVTLNHYAEHPLEIFLVTDQAGKVKASKVLHDRVTFAGPFSSPADMAKFYAARTAVICPSYFETYGNVAQEAVAAGTPALVSRNMGVAEICKRIGLGKLVVSFADDKKIYGLVQSSTLPHVTNSAREALREVAGEAVVHQKLLEFIRS